MNNRAGHRIGIFVSACALLAACSEDPCADRVTADIVPFVRLVASDTVHDAFPWPIEAVDAAATIRDENPDTSWKIPVSASADNGTLLTLDIQPWLGRQIPLGTFSMEFTGKFETVTIMLSGGCGGPVIHSIEWPAPYLPLDLDGLEAGCVKIEFVNTANAALDSLRIMAEVPECALESGYLNACGSASVRASESGLIEGFYGIPWSWSERKRLIGQMAANGLGTYLYCPKWDAKHRSEWREPYTGLEMELFTDLMAHANSLDVLFSFGISPFIDYNPAGKDYEILLNKALDFVMAGARGITLLADDIEFDTSTPVGGVMGAVHADVANRLLADIRAQVPETAMAFVPTVYSDDRLVSFDDGESYLAEMAGLHPDIRVMWTGTDTSASTMTATDMNDFIRITGRKPLIWDNFWANDGGDGFVGRILLGPFSGRTPDLAGAVTGIMHNPSIQGALTRLNLGNFAAWVKAPETYEAGTATENAALSESSAAGDAILSRTPATQTLLFVMQLFDGHARQMPGHRELMELTDALKDLISGGTGDPATGVGAMLGILGRMAVVESEVWHSAIAADMHDELIYPLQKIRHEGEAGLAILDAIVERSSGRTGESAISRANDALYLSNSCRFTFGEQKLEKLLGTVKKMNVSGSRFERVDVDSPPDCVTGRPLTWHALSDGITGDDVNIQVSGLPEAAVDGGVVTWIPPHSGTYRAMITVFCPGQPALFGYFAFEINCMDDDMEDE